jgi:NADH-quinone oxidoreductase subunit G
VNGDVRALVVGGVDPADFANPAVAHAALRSGAFVVSLETRRSAVTESAHVVLPVAPPAEKAGRFVTWEGRRRPFDLTIEGTGALTDGQVLDALAEELDVVLGLRTIGAARAELARLSDHRAGPRAGSGAWFAPIRKVRETHRGDGPRAGEALLATWHELLDAGRGQEGDEYLAGTAKPARAMMSAATSAENGLAEGDPVTISTAAGAVTLPVVVGPLPDRVVWLPTNARGSSVRSSLHAINGTLVRLSGGGR